MKEFPWSFAGATLLAQSLRDSAAATPVGGLRLAAEIPDIFLPLARNENSGMTMVLGVVVVCSEGDCRREVLTTG